MVQIQIQNLELEKKAQSKVKATVQEAEFLEEWVTELEPKELLDLQLPAPAVGRSIESSLARLLVEHGRAVVGSAELADVAAAVEPAEVGAEAVKLDVDSVELRLVVDSVESNTTWHKHQPALEFVEVVDFELELAVEGSDLERVDLHSKQLEKEGGAKEGDTVRFATLENIPFI